jgi:pilus assembly protein CpaF
VFVRRSGRLERGHGAPLRRDAFAQAGIDLDDVLGIGRWAP